MAVSVALLVPIAANTVPLAELPQLAGGLAAPEPCGQGRKRSLVSSSPCRLTRLGGIELSEIVETFHCDARNQLHSTSEAAFHLK